LLGSDVFERRIPMAKASRPTPVRASDIGSVVIAVIDLKEAAMRRTESKYSAVVSFNRNSLQVEVSIASRSQQHVVVRVQTGLSSLRSRELPIGLLGVVGWL
jgi:hypothetical protein